MWSRDERSDRRINKRSNYSGFINCAKCCTKATSGRLSLSSDGAIAVIAESVFLTTSDVSFATEPVLWMENDIEKNGKRKNGRLWITVTTMPPVDFYTTSAAKESLREPVPALICLCHLNFDKRKVFELAVFDHRFTFNYILYLCNASSSLEQENISWSEPCTCTLNPLNLAHQVETIVFLNFSNFASANFENLKF